MDECENGTRTAAVCRQRQGQCVNTWGGYHCLRIGSKAFSREVSAMVNGEFAQHNQLSLINVACCCVDHYYDGDAEYISKTGFLKYNFEF